jgi:uncharacterized membrane protein YedE/YeeE
MQSFTPLQGAAGGLLIGLSAAFFLLIAGRISGVSGIHDGGLRSPPADGTWRWFYLLGMPLGAGLGALLAPELVARPQLHSSWPLLALAGLLVGFGARLGGGCTSGHGVCGLSRFSIRSIVATGVFMVVAMAVVYVMRHWA